MKNLKNIRVAVSAFVLLLFIYVFTAAGLRNARFEPCRGNDAAGARAGGTAVKGLYCAEAWFLFC